MAENFFNRHFVWWSSRDSIAAEKISLLAVAEVIFSVAAYWWIAWYFETYAYLLISVLVAPLVLLRSDQSVALGVEMFVRFLGSDEEVPLRSAKGLSIVCLSAIAAAATSWLAADWFLIGHEGVQLYWRAMLIGIVAMNIGCAVATAVAGFRLDSVAVAIIVAVAIAIAVAVFGAGTILAAGAAAGAGAVVGRGLGAVELAGGAGILARATAIRLVASIQHIHRGIAAFPRNWRRVLFRIDLRHAPTLLPGICKQIPRFNVASMYEFHISEFKRTQSVEEENRVLFSLLTILILFIPSLLYRYSIKSTFWLYLPLIYVAHLPGRLRDGEGRKIWVRALPAKFIEGIRFAMAVLTLGIALFALIDAAALHDLLKAAGAGETPVTIFSLLVALDFGDIRPWQYFTLPSAALTIFLFLWLDSIRKDEAAGATIDALGWKIGTAIFADRVRSLLVYIWLALALYYFAEYAYGRCELPGWIMSWLEGRFGPLACPAPGN